MTLNATPKCCGRPMKIRDGQYVCGKCKGWVDTGLTLAAGRGDR